MTMHVAICAEGGSIALVGDTKVRTSELVMSEREPPSTVIHRSKIVFSDRYDVAVAMAGDGRVGTDPAVELAHVLSELEEIPDALGLTLVEWGNAYFKRLHPNECRAFQFPICTLMVVNPRCRYSPLWKVRINNPSSVDCSSRYMVCGNEENPAIFWLEFLDADKRGPLSRLTGAALITVGTAAKLNNYGVGGFDVHEYSGGTWHHWTIDEIDAITLRMDSTNRQLRRGAEKLGVRPVTPLQQ